MYVNYFWEDCASKGKGDEVLELTPPDLLFILETNGILIGHDESYARELSGFKNLYVRVSLKGTTEEEFSRLTGCAAEGFRLQLKAIENHSKGERECPLTLDGVQGKTSGVGRDPCERDAGTAALLRNPTKGGTECGFRSKTPGGFGDSLPVVRRIYVVYGLMRMGDY